MTFAGLLRLLEQWGPLVAPEPTRLRALEQPRCVVLVGASGAGKSTLARAARASGLPIDVPPRLVTRPPRDGDREHENVFLTPAAFEARAAGMALRWRRVMEGGRVERYGFPLPAAGRLALYSANDALLAQSSALQPPDALDGALVVAAQAPRQVREARLRLRSAQAWARAPGELAWRLDAPPLSSRTHLLVLNHGEHEAAAPSAFVRLLEAVCSSGAPPTSAPALG